MTNLRHQTVWVVSLLLVGILLVASAPALATSASDDTIVFSIITPEYRVTDSGVMVNGSAWNDVPGAPRLPYFARAIELPPTGAWRLSFRSRGEQIIAGRATVPSVPVPYLATSGPTMATSPEDLPDSVPTMDRPDPAIYNVDAFYPASPVVTGQEQWQRGRRLLAVRVFPFQYNPVSGELRYHPELDVEIAITPEPVLVAPASGKPSAGAPELRPWSGEPADVRDIDGAVRIRTGARGMHRLTRTDLLNAGVPANADPRSFTMSYLGQTIKISVPGEADGSFDEGDLVIFYAEPYVGRYMTNNVYWLTYGTEPAPVEARMATRHVSAAGGEPVVTTITQTLHIEYDRIYPDTPNYAIPTDADHWFDNALYPRQDQPVDTRTYSLPLDDALTVGSAQIRGLLYGGDNQPANPDQSVAVKLNGNNVATYQWKGRIPYSFAATVPASWLNQNPSQLVLEAALAQLPGLTYYYVYPDWVEISYPALADAEGDRLYAEGLPTGGADTGVLQVTGFASAEVRAYDVRDPRAPVQITSLQIIDTGSDYTAQVLDLWDAGDGPPAYELATDAALLAPQAVEHDDITTWRSPAHDADYIAIVHPSLAEAVQPLLAYRAGQGHTVATVFLQDIYDEFSYGLDYPPAIRDFLAYAYHCWNGADCDPDPASPPPPAPPQYVLLVGDGHYDFKGGHTTLLNLIPPYMIRIDPFWGETAADNRYVSVDGPNDYMPDMAIGRIPAQTPAQVTAVVDKILAYEDPGQAPDGAWQTRIVFAAGSNSDPAGAFHNLSDSTRFNWLSPQYTTQPIYYGTPNYNTAAKLQQGVKDAFDDSALLVQWFGHGARWFWGASGQAAWVVNYPTHLGPANLAANTQVPFTTAYNCWSGYFVNIFNNWQTLGESMVLQPGRSSVADLSPTGLHVGSALQILNQGVVTAIFRDRIRTVGDTVNTAKEYYFANSLFWHDVIDTSVLFGDPATRLRLPMIPPTPPAVGIAPGDDSVVLSWPHASDAVQYEIWRDTEPYFDPAEGEGKQVTTVDAGFISGGTPFTFNDDGTLPPPPVQIYGDPDINYFWVLRARNSDGASGVSNRVGEFDFRLAPGQ